MKADAQWKNDAERERVRRPVQQLRDVGSEEIVVLEEAQQPEVGRETDDQRDLAPMLRPRAGDPARGGVVNRCEREQQQDELRDEAHIEEIAGGEKNIFPQAARGGVEQNQDDGQKSEKLKRVEQHGLRFWRTQHAAHFGGEQARESFHARAVQVPGIPEKVGMLKLIEQMLVEHDDIRLRSNLANGAI